MSASLGVYIGPSAIYLVETEGNKILSRSQIKHSFISSDVLEDKVPEDVKIVALLKEELRKNKVTAKEASLCLSGKDLIIRTFDIPVLPPSELANVINFEVKKYIPFKVEELISDFQVELDKQAKRNKILYIGIKKETFEKYNTIFNELGIRINTLEYSGFSVLRFLKNLGTPISGISAVLSMDLRDEDEINFTVLQNNFPLFSRDITLALQADDFSSTTVPVSAESSFEKMKTEIRISLDYFNRKFPDKKIDKTFFVVASEDKSGLESFLNELGLATKYVDSAKLLGKSALFSLGVIKAYGANLFKKVKTNIKVSILGSKIKAKAARDLAVEINIAAVFSNIKLDVRVVIVGILICASTFGFMFFKKKPIEQEINTIVTSRPAVKGVMPDAPLEEMTAKETEFCDKIKEINNMISKQLYLTDELDALPRVVPKDIHLSKLYFVKGEKSKLELKLEGYISIEDSDKELKTINEFVLALKANDYFKKMFKDIAVTNITRSTQAEKKAFTSFVIACEQK